MKLILAILSNADAPAASSALTKQRFQITRLATTGGFLRAGNTTLIIGCEDERVQEAINILGEYSSQREEMVPNTSGYEMGTFTSYPLRVTVGGATIFVLNVEDFFKL